VAANTVVTEIFLAFRRGIKMDRKRGIAGCLRVDIDQTGLGLRYQFFHQPIVGQVTLAALETAMGGLSPGCVMVTHRMAIAAKCWLLTVGIGHSRYHQQNHGYPKAQRHKLNGYQSLG